MNINYLEQHSDEEWQQLFDEQKELLAARDEGERRQRAKQVFEPAYAGEGVRIMFDLRAEFASGGYTEAERAAMQSHSDAIAEAIENRGEIQQMGGSVAGHVRTMASNSPGQALDPNLESGLAKLAARYPAFNQANPLA